MGAGYQSLVDHFGLATADMVLIDSNTTPIPISIESARDEENNIAGQGTYEGGPAVGCECTYRLLGTSLDLSTLKIGYIFNDPTHTAATVVDVSTSATDWPLIKYTGFTGILNYANMPTFTLPEVTILGKRLAQVMDFTLGANCKLQSSNLNVVCAMAHALGTDGTVGGNALDGCEATISMEAVEISAAVSWTPDAAYEETQAPGASGGNIAWGKGSASMVKFITKD